VEWFRREGHRIVLPPEDVDSWVLGCAVVRAGRGADSPEGAGIDPGRGPRTRPETGAPDSAAALAAELGKKWSAEIEEVER
jgi:hypothetical protein